MKKSKIALGIVAGLASVTALASCSEVKPVKKDGYLLTYTSSSGEKIEYSTADLFGTYFNQSSSISSMFDKVYKLIVRNYFNVDNKTMYNDIKKNAQNDVEGVKSNANKNAESNKTSYSDEFDKLLESYNCEDEAELLEHFIYEREETEFQKQFYDQKTIFNVAGQTVTGTQWLRDARLERDGYEGYLEKKAPYHIRHILVKLSGTSSSNAYWNDTINEKDAKNLHTVASSLAQGELDFGQIAKNSSEYSDSSADNYGELDIMDKDTSYVNEFKLGIYAYENLYGPHQQAARNSEINMSYAAAKYDDIKGQKKIPIARQYLDAVTYVGDDATKDMAGDAEDQITTIPYGVFEAIKDYAVTTNTSSGEVVNEGNQAFYPRNVLFNKYLNKHSVAFITPNSIPANGTAGADHDTTVIDEENTVGVENPAYASMGGFRSVTINGVEKKVLCTTTGNPILVVRAGTSDYQGIHFIVIERSPLVDTANLGKYYTTYYPGQDEYEKEVGSASTYVNFLHQGTKDLKARAETVASKIKGFDSSNLNKEIYKHYVLTNKITFNVPEGLEGYDLEKAIAEWIETSATKTQFDAANNWENNWEDYINTLNQQKVERRKLVSEACAIGFTKSAKGDEWKQGGVCYVPTQK